MPCPQLILETNKARTQAALAECMIEVLALPTDRQPSLFLFSLHGHRILDAFNHGLKEPGRRSSYSASPPHTIGPTQVNTRTHTINSIISTCRFLRIQDQIEPLRKCSIREPSFDKLHKIHPQPDNLFDIVTSRTTGTRPLPASLIFLLRFHNGK